LKTPEIEKELFFFCLHIFYLTPTPTFKFCGKADQILSKRIESQMYVIGTGSEFLTNNILENSPKGFLRLILEARILIRLD
jgi:hypothetical protein